MITSNSTDYKLAAEFDKVDPLSHFRKEFVISNPDQIYLDGNSLGRLPKRTVIEMKKTVENEWGERLIRGWNDRWMNLPSEVGAKIAKIIGAKPDEVIMCDTTSIALFKLVYGAMRYQKNRKTILSDSLNFPSDLYIVEGVIDLMKQSHQLKLIQSSDDITISKNAIRDSLSEDVSIITLSHVAFKSAFMYDMEWLTREAHKKGALTLWDLSHAVGAVPIKLNRWNVDLAIGCTYKYLNAGPGSPAFLYVRKDLQDRILQPIWGWLGAERPFDFELKYEPARGIRQQITSSPPILGMKSVEMGVDLILEAGIENLREKSVRQTEYMISLIKEWLYPLGFSPGSPLDSKSRGSHVSIRHPEAYRINRALIEAPAPAIQVIPDFREPDSIRLGVTPLYTTYKEIYLTIHRIKEIVEEDIFKDYGDEKLFVT